ncbi:MAG: HNH endonuclease [Elusimicrobiota bacterium]
MQFKPKRLSGYTEADIIQEIKRVVLEEYKGVVPTRKEFARVARLHLSTVWTKFGSYEEAVRKAGFTYTEKYSIEQVKSNLCEVLKRADGYCFTYDFYRKNGGVYSVKTVKSILRTSWEGVLTAIGAKKCPRIIHVQVSAHAQRRKAFTNLTEDDLFKEIDRIWQLKNRRPTYDEFHKLSSLGIRTYERRFGSWIKAIEAFCRANRIPIQGKGGTWVTKEILFNELKNISAKVPKVSFTYPVYKANGGTYSNGCFNKYFGSWTKAASAAGRLSGKPPTKYSDEELFDEIQRLWEQFGRQPTSTEMEQIGKFSTGCYMRRFGSWIKAVHTFCDDRNSDSALIPPPILELPSVPRIPSEPEKKEPPVVIPSAESATLIIAHKTGRSVPIRLRWRVFARDNFTCKGCGRSPGKHTVVLEADHIIAWTNGGETIFENLQTLCGDCNKGKSDL